jgi:hypothetical protein
MNLKAELRKCAEAGVISDEHCTQICDAFLEHSGGAVTIDISRVSDGAFRALDAAILWLDSAAE